MEDKLIKNEQEAIEAIKSNYPTSGEMINPIKITRWGNKKFYEESEETKNEINCVNCKYCNQRAYYGGKWYCANLDIKIGKAAEIEKCFARKEKK